MNSNKILFSLKSLVVVLILAFSTFASAATICTYSNGTTGFLYSGKSWAAWSGGANKVGYKGYFVIAWNGNNHYRVGRGHGNAATYAEIGRTPWGNWQQGGVL